MIKFLRDYFFLKMKVIFSTYRTGWSMPGEGFDTMLSLPIRILKVFKAQLFDFINKPFVIHLNLMMCTLKDFKFQFTKLNYQGIKKLWDSGILVF